MPTTYGERFQRIRLGPDWAPGKEARLTQEKVAKALNYERPAAASVLEVRNTSVPKVATIRKHAMALQCDPGELLKGVLTEHDQLRDPALQRVIAAWPYVAVKRVKETAVEALEAAAAAALALEARVQIPARGHGALAKGTGKLQPRLPNHLTRGHGR